MNTGVIMESKCCRLVESKQWFLVMMGVGLESAQWERWL